MNAVMKPAETLPAVTPAQMLQMAVQQGADLDKLEKLMELQERWEASQARKAWVSAMAAFKANPPSIGKNKHVRFTNKAGTVTDYWHATLDNVCDVVASALSRHGLSHRWETKQENGRIAVTCYITHIGGHSESTSLHGPADDSGGKNQIQGIGSAVTYLQRYTLLALTGLATGEQDDDGKAGQDYQRISASQVADLTALAQEVGADIPKLLQYWQVDRMEDINALAYKDVVASVERKRRR
jgi:hypothetical protein